MARATAGAAVTPNPTPLVQPDAEAQRLDCARRSLVCLARAAREDWPGLSCSSCTAFAPMTAEQREVELDGLTRVGTVLVQIIASGREIERPRRVFRPTEASTSPVE